jgi:hypothetical protein
MNTNTSIFLARDHAADLLGEAERERLARSVQESKNHRAASVRRAISRLNFFSLRRSPAGCP